MSSKPVDLNYFLYQILIGDQLDNFSVLDLRDAFLKASRCPQDNNWARRFVYRHILRLERALLLERVSVKSSAKPLYRKTPLFAETVWNVVFEEFKQESESTEVHSQEDSVIFLQEILKKRLEQCESDFLACIHEFETYKNLCSEYPHLMDSLFDVQRQTKTQSSKLMGEIRAFKMALALS
ncbi:hypothetical protein AB4370_18465 [Vibrio cyclitrophicus]